MNFGWGKTEELKLDNTFWRIREKEELKERKLKVRVRSSVCGIVLGVEGRGGRSKIVERKVGASYRDCRGTQVHNYKLS